MWDFLWHPVQVRTDSVVFNLMDDGEYWNHRPFFYDVSFPFCILCRCCWLLFTTMYADRAVVLQYEDFHRMRLIWLCGNPVMVTVSMWLSQRDHFQHVKDQLDFGFTRISLLHKLPRYSKDYTKFKFPCSFLCSMGRTSLMFGKKKKTSEWVWLCMWTMRILAYVITMLESPLEWHELTIVCCWSCEFHLVWWHKRGPILPADTCWGGQRLSCWV